MRKQIGHRFGFVTAALVVLGSSASGASDPKEQQLSEVVMKSLGHKTTCRWSRCLDRGRIPSLSRGERAGRLALARRRLRDAWVGATAGCDTG